MSVEYINVVSWNISGGYDMNNRDALDDLYIPTLNDIGSHDIALIQEAHRHSDDTRSSLPRLAGALGMRVLTSVDLHQSHINPDYTLAMGILASPNLLATGNATVGP